MLNYIWSFLVVISLIFAFFTGNLQAAVEGCFQGCANAVETVLSICGLLCLWSGFMKVAEGCGFIKRLSSVLSPVLKWLFPDIRHNPEALGHISMNIAANLLGLANAATPLGLRAMEALDKENGEKKRASRSMCMFAVLNTASFQLIPSTVIALRAGAGSSAPSAILVPIWITSLVSLAVGIVLVKLIER